MSRPGGRRVRIPNLLGILLLAAACAEGASGLGPPEVTSIERMIIPAQASATTDGSAVVTGGPARLNARAYQLPRGVTPGAVREWYRNEGVPGRSWRVAWQWCREARGASGADDDSVFIWRDSARGRILAISIFENTDDLARGTDAFGLTIVDVATSDQADPAGVSPECDG